MWVGVLLVLMFMVYAVIATVTFGLNSGTVTQQAAYTEWFGYVYFDEGWVHSCYTCVGKTQLDIASCPGRQKNCTRTIGESMYSLFQIMTLESWSMGIVREVRLQSCSIFLEGGVVRLGSC